jgi:DNA processing protein
VAARGPAPVQAPALSVGRDGVAAPGVAPGVWDDAERVALVALLRVRPGGVSWPQIVADVADAGSARAVWARLVPATLFDQDLDTDHALLQAEEDVARWRGADFTFLTFRDPHYPGRLREVHQMPPVLFARGRLVPGDLGVCVVGSRNASAHGLAFARRTASALVDQGLTVVSGLAAGIDTAAHQAALEHGGRTVAVIGTGIERAYPAENVPLQEQIADAGLVVSQFWPDAAPTKQSFPLRNAVMSAYGLATVVVEAGETSGARIQARLAVEHGRPVILTQTVAAATTWGQALVGRPGVHVADTPAQVIDIVQHVMDLDARVDRLLAAGAAEGAGGGVGAHDSYDPIACPLTRGACPP